MSVRVRVIGSHEPELKLAHRPKTPLFSPRRDTNHPLTMSAPPLTPLAPLEGDPRIKSRTGSAANSRRPSQSSLRPDPLSSINHASACQSPPALVRPVDS